MYLKLKIVFNFLCEIFSDLFSPPLCFSCQIFLNKRVIFCKFCALKIAPLAPFILKFGSNKKCTVYAVMRYCEPVRKLILSKYYLDTIALNKLGLIIYEYSIFKYLDFDYLIPIPLHWVRQLQRGFNQAEIIAQSLSKFSGKPLLNILKRVKNTKAQFTLKKELRFKNLETAFELNKSFKNFSFLKNKKILLVDDLCTTGATLLSAARVLKKCKLNTINAVVVARG